MRRSFIAPSLTVVFLLFGSPAFGDCPPKMHWSNNHCELDSPPPDPRAVADQAQKDAKAVKDKADRAAKAAKDKAEKDAKEAKKRADAAANQAADTARAAKDNAQAQVKALLKSSKDPAACARLGLLWSPAPAPHCVDQQCKAGEFYTPVGCIKGDVKALLQCVVKLPPDRREARNPRALQQLALDRANKLLAVVASDLRTMFHPDPADKITSGASALKVFMRRLDAAGQADPGLKCLANFVRPTLLVMGPQVDVLVAHGRAMMQQVFREVVQKHIDEVVKQTVLQSGAMLVGEDDATAILKKRVAQYLYDIDNMKAGARTISAVATAVGKGEGALRATAEMKKALTRKRMERARFTFAVVGDVLDLKARQWASKGCAGPWAPKKSEEKEPKKDAGDKGATKQAAAKGDDKGEAKEDWLGADWAQHGGNKVHEQLVQKAEDLIPGGHCLVDYSVKPLETLNTSLKSAVASACNIAPDATFTGLIAVYGGGTIPLGARVTAGLTLACSAFLWAYDKVASVAISQLKAEGYRLAEAAVLELTRKARADLEAEIERRHGFTDADKFIAAMQGAGGPSGLLVRSIDGGMLLFMNKYAGRFLDAMDAYQASIRDLGDTAALLAKGGAK